MEQLKNLELENQRLRFVYSPSWSGKKLSFQRRTSRNMSKKRTQGAEEKIGRCWKRDHKSEKHDAASRWKVCPCLWELPYLHAAWDSSVESSLVRTTLNDSELLPLWIIQIVWDCSSDQKLALNLYNNAWMNAAACFCHPAKNLVSPLIPPWYHLLTAFSPKRSFPRNPISWLIIFSLSFLIHFLSHALGRQQ